jgi:hypothetical protein
MMNTNIDIIEMSYEESVSYLKCLENLVKNSCTSVVGPATLPVDDKKRVSVTSSVGKSFKNPKASNLWCHLCDKSMHNMADCRAITKFE